MNNKHRKTARAIGRHALVRYEDAARLLIALGAEKIEGERVQFVWADGLTVHLHAPHPAPELKRYAVRALAVFLAEHFGEVLDG